MVLDCDVDGIASGSAIRAGHHMLCGNTAISIRATAGHIIQQGWK